MVIFFPWAVTVYVTLLWVQGLVAVILTPPLRFLTLIIDVRSAVFTSAAVCRAVVRNELTLTVWPCAYAGRWRRPRRQPPVRYGSGSGSGRRCPAPDRSQ